MSARIAASWRPQGESTGRSSSVRTPRAESWMPLSSDVIGTPPPRLRSALSSPTMRSISASTIVTAVA